MNTRLGIAASLIGDPPLLIWDEPTAGLDPAARRFTLDLIRELGRKRTVILATHILSDIDQVCSHVGVMHEGRMIFSGSMRDMKRRLRRNAFHLDLEGDGQAIQQLASQVNAIPGVEASVGASDTLAVELADGIRQAAALAEVLKLADAANLSLQDVHSIHNETEDVYLQLLQEDEAHGFQRFHLEADHGDHAVHGDSRA